MAAPSGIRMAAVFGEAKPEYGGHDADALPRRPVLFHAHAPSQTPLRVVATDLRSLAWRCSLDLDDLQNLVRCFAYLLLSFPIPSHPVGLLACSSCVSSCLVCWDSSIHGSNPKQDDVGIGGSCSDFLDYLYSSFSSAQVKLLFPAAQGPNTAELVATKAKGLPRITLPLHPVAASELKDVIADFSLALYASYKTKQEHASREQERVSQLMESLASEREKNEVMQKQLEALSFLDKRKATKPKLVTDQVPSAPLGSDQFIVPVQKQTSVASPSKVPPAKATKRVAHASRRARGVRGALLQDDNDDES
ncbi:unnamed protein product [Urochloa decumbens]|uniref:Uncharacterized protein n=1 Tax=Urochloa decumbens TaxID=240449 RepID=A0ABC9GQ89_9POAL